MIERTTADVLREFGGGEGGLSPVEREIAYARWNASARPGRQSITGFVSASLLALLSLAWGMLRHGSGRPPGGEGMPWLAVHGEISNRTRHLLAIVPAGQSIPLLVLGRPKQSLSSIGRMFAKEVPAASFHLFRPIGLAASLRASGAMAGAFAAAFRTLRRQSIRLRFGDLVAILYRVALGEAGRAWWSGVRARPSMVVFGHTGNADTSALELAMQADGVATVHLFHGVSTGIPFLARSSLALTRCRHDRDWHSAIGGYRATACLEAEKPALRAPSGRLMIATNYAHPMARPDADAGVRREYAALAMMRDCVDWLGGDRSSVVYRPHPAGRALPPKLRRRLSQAALETGFSGQAEGQGLGDFDIVVTTPSTIVQDALVAGTIPICLDLAGSDPQGVYGDYPFRATNAEELADCIRQIRTAPQAAFDRAWDSVGPATAPSLAQIEQTVAQVGA